MVQPTLIRIILTADNIVQKKKLKHTKLTQLINLCSFFIFFFFDAILSQNNLKLFGIYKDFNKKGFSF
ncbi:MAG TPA: hypothetical protein PLP15_05625, partial [Bacilli bacterium]|nr:hypothetical protein [Bacilli bacterium]